MDKKKIFTIIALGIVVAIIAVFPLVIIKDSEFGGADGMAEDAISEINPQYTPWVESIMEPPGGETESLLFSLQSALGAIVIGYGFGYYTARKKYSKVDM